jgi:hypothetical protein
MSKETQYEVVPIEDLTPEQSYHVQVTEPTSSLEVGAAAVAGKGALEVAKAAPSGIKRIAEIIGNRTPEVTVGPITTETGANVPKVGPTGKSANAIETWAKTQHIDPATGKPLPYLSGGDYGAEHRLQMTAKEVAERKAALDRINMLFDSAPQPPTAPAAPAAPAMSQGRFIPELAHLPAGSPEYFEALDKYIAGQPVEPPKVAPLTPAQRAMQVAQGIGGKAMGMAQPIMNALNSPVMQKLNPALVGLGYFGAGTEGMEAYKRAKHGDYGRALIDAIGAGGTLASIHAPHPAAKVLGLGAGLGAHYLNKKLDEKYGRDYATGGLVYIGK